MCRIDGCDSWDYVEYLDDEEPEALWDMELHFVHERVARRPQVCGECGRTIAVGQGYRIEGGRMDWAWRWHRTCEHCCAAREWLGDFCGGWIYGDVFAELVEHDDEDITYRSPRLSMSIAGMRCQWTVRGHLIPIESVRAALVRSTI